MISRGLALVTGAAVLSFANACPAEPEDGDQRAARSPSCAGQFCFNAKPMNEGELVGEYGTGYSEAGKFPYHCYEAQPGGPFVRFRIEHGAPHEVLDIFVSDRLSCPAAKTPAKALGKLATESGLALGDSRGRVVELYGEPARMADADDLEMVGAARGTGDPAPFGDTEMLYYAKDPETLHAIVYLRDGVVSAFLISRFP